MSGAQTCVNTEADIEGAATSQGTWRLTGGSEARSSKKDSCLESLEGVWPGQPLDFQLLISRTLRKGSSVASSQHVWSHLLQQQQGTDTYFCSQP